MGIPGRVEPLGNSVDAGDSGRRVEKRCLNSSLHYHCFVTIFGKQMHSGGCHQHMGSHCYILLQKRQKEVQKVNYNHTNYVSMVQDKSNDTNNNRKGAKEEVLLFNEC